MSLVENLSLVAFAFSSGVFTFFAPCAYPLLPGYVSYYLGRSTAEGIGYENGGTATERTGVAGRLSDVLGVFVSSARAQRLAPAVVVGLLVSAGFFVVYGVLAGVVAAVGTRLLSGISVLELVVGVVLVILGSGMAAGWEAPSPSIRLPARRRSRGAYFGFGVLYGAAAAGCTAPIFIGVALKALSVGAGLSLATFVAYASGMSVLMVGVTLGTALGRDSLYRRFSRRVGRLRRAAGVLLVTAGVVEIYFFLFRFDGFAFLGV